MSSTCPNGHESEWADYCSTCGEPLGGAAPGPSGSDPANNLGSGSDPANNLGSGSDPANNLGSGSDPANSCSNCGEPHRPDDVFCENCGFDFASQTLPDAGAVAPVVPSGSVATPTVAVVIADRGYYDATIGDNDLVFPDPAPAAVEIPLVGAKALIGRHSESRGIFPEIDVSEITEDPAASSRHAMLTHDDDGNWSVEDLGSTNGTIIGDPEGEEIAHGTPIPIAHNTPIYVGAWTRIEIQER